MPKERIKEEANAELAKAILKFAEKLEYEVIFDDHNDIESEVEQIIIDHNTKIIVFQ